MAKIVLVGSNSELGNATARKFMNERPDLYGSVFRVGRSAETSDLVWHPVSADTDEILEVINQCNLKRGDLVIIAIAKLVEGIIQPSIESLRESEVFESITVTATIPSVLTVGFVRKFESLGDGSLILFSSAAAFPPLAANIFYSASKLALDKIASELGRSASRSGVKVSIVRPGFVPTPMNAKRKPTAFATTVEQVAADIYKKHPQRVIWSPASLRAVTAMMRFFPLLRRRANQVIISSMQNLN